MTLVCRGPSSVPAAYADRVLCDEHSVDVHPGSILVLLWAANHHEQLGQAL